MRKIADEGEDEFVEEEKKKEKDGVVAVKDDPQFTLAITRGNDNRQLMCTRQLQAAYLCTVKDFAISPVITLKMIGGW